MFILQVLVIGLCLRYVNSAEIEKYEPLRTGQNNSIENDSNVLITTKGNSTECGRSKTLSCKVKNYKFAVEWLQDKNRVPIAKCTEFDKCSMNPNYNGTYQLTSDVNKGVFNLTIMNVTRHDEGRTLMCSDGTNKAVYIVKVEDYKLRVSENTIKRTLTVETGCVYQGTYVYFKWTQKHPVSKKEIPFEPLFPSDNVTNCTEDSKCGNNQQIKRSQSIFAIRGKAKYNIKIVAKYENGHVEILELKDTFEVDVADAHDSTYDAVTDDKTVGIAIAVSVPVTIIIACIIVVVLYIFIKYRRNRNNPDKPVIKLRLPCCSSIIDIYISNEKDDDTLVQDTKDEERQLLEEQTDRNNATEEKRWLSTEKCGLPDLNIPCCTTPEADQDDQSNIDRPQTDNGHSTKRGKRKQRTMKTTIEETKEENHESITPEADQSNIDRPRTDKENKTNSKEQKTNSTNTESIGGNNTKSAYRVIRFSRMILIFAIYSNDQEEEKDLQHILKELEMMMKIEKRSSFRRPSYSKVEAPISDQENIELQKKKLEEGNMTSLKDHPNDNKGGHSESSRSRYGNNTYISHRMDNIVQDHSDHESLAAIKKQEKSNHEKPCQVGYKTSLKAFGGGRKNRSEHVNQVVMKKNAPECMCVTTKENLT